MIVEDKYKDVIKELVNIGIGKGASILNKLLHSHIELSVLQLYFLQREQIHLFLSSYSKLILSGVNMPFDSNISGSAKLIFTTDNASKLVSLFTQTSKINENVDLDLIRSSTLMEIGNIVINAIVGTISNQLKFHFKYSIPNYIEGTAQNLIIPNDKLDDWIIMVCKTSFVVQTHQIEGTFILLFEMDSLNYFIEAIEKLFPDYLNMAK